MAVPGRSSSLCRRLAVPAIASRASRSQRSRHFRTRLYPLSPDHPRLSHRQSVADRNTRRNPIHVRKHSTLEDAGPKQLSPVWVRAPAVVSFRRKPPPPMTGLRMCYGIVSRYKYTVGVRTSRFLLYCSGRCSRRQIGGGWVYSMSRMGIASRPYDVYPHIPTMPGRTTSCFPRPDRGMM